MTGNQKTSGSKAADIIQASKLGVSSPICSTSPHHLISTLGSGYRRQLRHELSRIQRRVAAPRCLRLSSRRIPSQSPSVTEYASPFNQGRWNKLHKNQRRMSCPVLAESSPDLEQPAPTELWQLDNSWDDQSEPSGMFEGEAVHYALCWT
jgi:hypothetical protein